VFPSPRTQNQHFHRCVPALSCLSKPRKVI
jgi:hypothetical protein